MYHNYFRGHKKGFFVDVGSNHFEEISNSIFFEKCLGWEGLCVEPNPQYYEGYRARPRCKLIRNCVSDVERDVFLSDDTTGSKISDSGIRVRCKPLEKILEENNVTHVDFLSLDIEGHEPAVLNSFPFDKFSIQLWLMETAHINKIDADRSLLLNGFSKVFNLHIDDLYEKNPSPPKIHPPGEVWRPLYNQWLGLRPTLPCFK